MNRLALYGVRLGVCALGAAVLVAGGCAGRPGAAATPATVEVAAPAMFDVQGAAVTMEALTDRALAADVVIIGEEHDNARAQALAAELWEQVLSRQPMPPVNPALALEFFERDQQLVVDDYLAGIIPSATAFERDARRSAGNYPAGHKRMLEAAKGAGRPVIAANVPRRYASYARSEGFEALRELDGQRRAMFTIPQPPELEEYRRRFAAVMRPMLDQHGAPPPPAADGRPPDVEAIAAQREKQIAELYRAQILKDATMADAVARAVEAGYAPVFLVVGRFHSDAQGGTLAYLRRRLPEAEILTLSAMRTRADEAPADVMVVAP